eukprot:10144379-Karenia_brevis.AAC.1
MLRLCWLGLYVEAPACGPPVWPSGWACESCSPFALYMRATFGEKRGPIPTGTPMSCNLALRAAGMRSLKLIGKESSA